MRIAFYAPLKPPDHPVPSGDRLMARLLMQAMRQAGHTVELASQLRARAAEPQSHEAIRDAAIREVDRLRLDWRAGAAPDLFFCYHLYYKAPDFIGPELAGAFGIPYVAAEASLSPRRDTGVWSAAEEAVREALARASLLLCFTRRDQDGLLRAMPHLVTARILPFIETATFGPRRGSKPLRLVTVAMMRSGDKLDSYRILADALRRCVDLSWSLAIVGGGQVRGEVEGMFAAMSDRVAWTGEVEPHEVPAILAEGDIYVWPGIGEAYGMAYLEAQAAGLPVVAQAIAGVPEVVRDGMTGLLTRSGDIGAYAGAIRTLISDAGMRNAMSARARASVREEHSMERAAGTLKTLLARFEP